MRFGIVDHAVFVVVEILCDQIPGVNDLLGTGARGRDHLNAEHVQVSIESRVETVEGAILPDRHEFEGRFGDFDHVSSLVMGTCFDRCLAGAADLHLQRPPVVIGEH